MKNKHLWKPTKYVFKKNELVGSRDKKHVEVSSRLFVDLTAEYYSKYLQEHCKGDLLDLGCGNVPLYEAYKEFISDNTCIDWNNSPHKNNYLDFEYDLTKPIHLPDESFDTIIISDVLEHIPNPENLWNEIYRLLKINGKVILNTPFFYYLHEKPYDYYRHTECSLKRLAKMSNIKLLLLKPIGGSPEVISDIIARHIIHVPVIGKYLSIEILFLCHKFIKTSIGAKISLKTSELFPYGYFLIGKKCD